MTKEQKEIIELKQKNKALYLTAVSTTIWGMINLVLLAYFLNQ